MTLHGLQGQSYQLEPKPFSSGGEGDIYSIVGMIDKVVKIYHADRITPELEQKLDTMAKRPPSSRVLSQVAWPLDVVYDQNNRFCGFVMPRLRITAELSEIYVYPPKTNITYQQKLILAQNICVVISEVHKAGYVFGDFNPRNIGVNTNTGTVAFLDTDSYHIVVDKANSKAFRCNVCAPGYAAPELLEKCAQHISQHPEDSKRAYAATPLDTFTKETDNFALAIHMFKLLMNGYTPFGGIKETESASVGSPGVGDAAVRRDSYCFKPGNKPQAAAIPPLESLPQEIADLFTRAFMYGKIDPKQRPSALEWHKALTNYESSLKKCSKNPAHMYHNALHSCPWCEADDRYTASIAPSISQKGFQTPVSPSTSFNRSPAVTSPPAGASGSSSYIGRVGSNAAAAGGSTYTAPIRQAPARPSFFQKYKGWIIAAVVVFVIMLMAKGCSSSNAPKRSLEILTDEPTISVGETISIRIKSTTNRVTANYNENRLSLDWGSTSQSGGYYYINANVTGVGVGESVLTIYFTDDASVSDIITIDVKAASNPDDGENQNIIDTNDGSSVSKAKMLPVNMATTGFLESSSDVMWYVLALEESGTVTFNMKYPQQDYADSYWGLSVYAEDNSSNYIMYCSYSGKSTDFSDSVESDSQLLGLDAGIYYVKITDGYRHSSVTYTLTADFTATAQCEMEPNNSYGTASHLQPNTAYTGSLLSSDDVDWYVLTLKESGTIVFNMKYPRQDYADSYWGLSVYAEDNSSNYIMYCSYSGKSTDFSDSIESDSQLLGLDAGTYYVKITDGYRHSSTTYTLTAVFTATAQCEMESNNSYGEASTLQTNVAYTGSLSSSDDIDWYVFTLESPGTVTFDMKYSQQDYADSYWGLAVYAEDNSSNYLMYCSYSGKQTTTNSNQIALNAGTYYVKITDGYRHSTTPYTLTVKR